MSQVETSLVWSLSDMDRGSPLLEDNIVPSMELSGWVISEPRRNVDIGMTPESDLPFPSPRGMDGP